MRRMLLVCALAAITGFGSQPVKADVTILTASKVVFVDAVGGEVVALVQFDVSSLSEALVIDEAHLEWVLKSAPSDGTGEFALMPVFESWDGEQNEEALEAVASQEPMFTWEIPETDYERSGGFVRFELDGLVRSWVNGEEANRGVAILLQPFTRQAVMEEPLPTLVVYHSGRRTEGGR